jgi:hypothetical protein
MGNKKLTNSDIEMRRRAYALLQEFMSNEESVSARSQPV